MVPWLIDSVIQWSVHSLLHWLTESLNHCFIDSLIHWLLDSMTQLQGALNLWTFVHCFIDSLIHWISDSFAYSTISSLISFIPWFSVRFNGHWLVVCWWIIDEPFVSWTIESLTDWFVDSESHWFNDALIHWLTESFIDSIHSIHSCQFISCHRAFLSLQASPQLFPAHKQVLQTNLLHYSHVHFSKLPPRRVPGTIGNNGL